MTAQPQTLKIRRPDDWHIHLRDDEMLSTVLPYTSEVFARAIVMPNLAPLLLPWPVLLRIGIVFWQPCQQGINLRR